MKLDWRVELPSWFLILGMFVTVALTWKTAPDSIPVHWGITMQPDRYGGRFEGLLVLPLMALSLYFLLLFLPRIDPGRANYARFSGAYAIVRLTVIALLAGIYGITQLYIHGTKMDFRAVMPLLLGIVFVVLGNLMGKIRPNWFVGIRTPWTLTSKVAWVRTHRLGGWVFVFIGLISMASALIASTLAYWIVIGALLAGVLALQVYSYLVWRQDPDKISPAGTEPS